MFSIRKVPDDLTPNDQAAIAEVQAIMRRQFPGIGEEDVGDLPAKLRDPIKDRLRSILFVAESRGTVRGFALLRHAPDLKFCYLDLISAAPGRRGGGVGSALYQRVREESQALHASGLYFECLPDDPALSPDPVVRKENASRLAFYERYGARPLANTAYETPLTPGGDNPPYLVLDDLGSGQPVRRKAARAIVRAILERKYTSVCPPSYVDMVVRSITDDPIRLRDYRYRKQGPAASITGRRAQPAPDHRIVLVVNEGHEIHHMRERGYVESPVRIASILEQILPTGLFRRRPPRHHAERYITAVHERDFVRYLRRASALVPDGRSIYPYTFPIRNQATPPKELPLRAGYYCIDTFTPINRNAYKAAVGAVDCTLTGAEALLAGERMAYALVRPPGHHAETRSFGGFCYFNSAAVAAQLLAQHGPVAMLDIDYHHGNGQEEIFYGRADVLTVSIHGPPRTTYPYFSGFKEDRGSGAGQGFNLNLPLPERVAFATFLATLERALRRIARFRPRFLLVCLGLDTARGDPTGSWNFGAVEFQRIGRAIGSVRAPLLVVQEGGYRTRSLGVNARNFFEGLHAAAVAVKPPQPGKRPSTRAKRPA